MADQHIDAEGGRIYAFGLQTFTTLFMVAEAKPSATIPIPEYAVRYAIYFAPASTDRLTDVASRWLGRDAFSNLTFPLEGNAEISPTEALALTADPRRYGFHATLKAPFHLAPGKSEAELLEAFEGFCSQATPFDIPNAILGQIGAFFAIVPDQTYPVLQTFAASVVEAFEPFRASLGAADIARRKPEKLSEPQRANLDQWGYPYVFDEFRFHMTLTGQVPAERQAAFRDTLETRFADFINRPLTISGLALFREEERGAPFTVQSWLPLGGHRYV